MIAKTCLQRNPFKDLVYLPKFIALEFCNVVCMYVCIIKDFETETEIETQTESERHCSQSDILRTLFEFSCCPEAFPAV
jgi:hypothetical protein